MTTAFTIGERDVQRGQRATVDLPVSTLTNHTHVTLPVHVVHGEAEGPVLFLSGAIHGDEIQGVEIIRRILTHPALMKLCGTLLAVPIVNSFECAFLEHHDDEQVRERFRLVIEHATEGQLDGAGRKYGPLQ
jgi:predicted deacylase